MIVDGILHPPTPPYCRHRFCRADCLLFPFSKTVKTKITPKNTETCKEIKMEREKQTNKKPNTLLPSFPSHAQNIIPYNRALVIFLCYERTNLQLLLLFFARWVYMLNSHERTTKIRHSPPLTPHCNVPVTLSRKYKTLMLYTITLLFSKYFYFYSWVGNNASLIRTHVARSTETHLARFFILICREHKNMSHAFSGTVSPCCLFSHF